MKRTYFIFAVAGLLIGLLIGYGLLSKEPGILAEEQIRQIVRERPGSMHLDVKPETVEFVNLSLEFREGRRVWVVDYECEGRTIPLPGMSIQPFTRMLIRVVRDAYTGGLMYGGPVDLEPGIWDDRVDRSIAERFNRSIDVLFSLPRGERQNINRNFH